jgi:hypothetical protein
VEEVIEGHEDCRLKEFIRWNRPMLIHERGYLSRIMAEGLAFMSYEDKSAVLHEITDIDWALKWHPVKEVR